MNTVVKICLTKKNLTENVFSRNNWLFVCIPHQKILYEIHPRQGFLLDLKILQDYYKQFVKR